MLVGCGSDTGSNNFEFDNQTSVRVAIYRVGADGREIGVVGGLDPGGSTFVRGFPGLTASGGTCQVLTLIARDQANREVGRHEGEICVGGQWNIGASPGPTWPTVPALAIILVVVAAVVLMLVRRAWLRVTR